MATYYWVGGTGNWDATATKWASSSGGAGGAGVPTSTDNVVFDANSDSGGAFTVTVTATAYCNDFSTGGAGGALDAAMTLAGNILQTWYVYGNLTLPATNFTSLFNGRLRFASTTTGKTITSNGKALGTGWVYFDGVGGSWTLQDAISVGNILYVQNGTFNANNQNVTCGNFDSSFTTLRTVNMGSGTWNITLGNGAFAGCVWNTATTTNLTFNYDTSQINIAGNIGYFVTGGLTFYNVAFNTAGATSSMNIIGASTFNNLSFSAGTADGMSLYGFYGTQIVNGTLSTTSTATTKRVYIGSTTSGIGDQQVRTIATGNQVTFKVAACSLVNTDFLDILIDPTSATYPLTGTRLGNCGNNSGITFPAAKTVYWNLTGAQNWHATAWAATSGGVPGVDNFPLAQDTAIFDNTGAVTTVTMSAQYSIPNVDMTARTTAMTFTNTAGCYLDGDWKNGTGVTLTGTGVAILEARTVKQIKGAGVPFTFSMRFNCYGGEYQLQDNVTFNTASLFNGGTINLNNFTLTLSSLSSSTAFTKAISFGTGKIILTGTGSVWSLSGTPTLTGTSDIVIGTQSGAVTFAGGGLTYSKLTLGNDTNSAAQVTISGSNTFGEITSNKFSGVLLLTSSTTQTVTNFTYGGYKESLYNVQYAGLTSTNTTAANLAKSGVGTINTNYLKVSYVNVTPSNTWNALNSLSVIGTNTNWSFSGYSGIYGYTDDGNPIENKYVTKDYVTEYYPDLIPGLQSGVIYGWGINQTGQLGDGTLTSRSSPVTFVGKSGGWKRIETRGGATLAQANDGSLWYMGPDAGTSSPKSIPSGTDWKSIAVGYGNGSGSPYYAIKNDGTLWSWGTNYDGCLGGPGGASPNTVTGGGTNWKQVSSGHRFVMAIKTDGTMWACGYNNKGQYGNGNTSAYSSFVSAALGTTGWKTVAAGQWGVSAIKTDGTLWSCGYNTSTGLAQLGDGTTVTKSSFVSVAGGGNNWKDVKSDWGSVVALKTDGTLWTWGKLYGTSYNSPISAPGGGTNWKSISIGGNISGQAHIAAIKTDGTLWKWGNNVYGQLGDGTASSRSSPVQTVLGGTAWKEISSGFVQSLGIVDSSI